jgi:uncharacterized protein (DUF2336 family)
MNAHGSLMDELEEAVQSGSREKRVDTLRRVTDLFLVASSSQLSMEQIGVFDDVLTHLVARVETKARAELAKRIAPSDQAPNEVVRRLAQDDEIAVAGPVLTQSNRLTTTDLLNIAQNKGQAHLLAIAGRATVAEQVTDVLVNRGDRTVMHRLAGNTGAAFSESGYSNFVKRAAGDESLIHTLGSRLDMSLQLLRELLLRATDAVRTRLMASVAPERQEALGTVLTNISQEIERESPAARSFEDANRLVSLLKETGRLNEGEISIFAKQGKYQEAIAGLATLCSVPLELIQRLGQSGRLDALLVPCKAAGLGWPTVRALLELRGAGQTVAEHDLDIASKEFSKLSTQTAARVLRFWQVRQTTTQTAE